MNAEAATFNDVYWTKPFVLSVDAKTTNFFYGDETFHRPNNPHSSDFFMIKGFRYSLCHLRRC